MKVVTRSFLGDDLIKNIPMQRNMEELCQYVAKTYFEPPLEDLIPYKYPGKQRVGIPIPLKPDTTLRAMYDAQKDRHVQWHRLSLYGKTDLSMLHLYHVPI